LDIWQNIEIEYVETKIPVSRFNLKTESVRIKNI